MSAAAFGATIVRERSSSRFLKAAGSDEAIQLSMFDWAEAQRVCVVNGWGVADGRPADGEGG